MHCVFWIYRTLEIPIQTHSDVPCVWSLIVNVNLMAFQTNVAFFVKV